MDEHRCELVAEEGELIGHHPVELRPHDGEAELAQVKWVVAHVAYEREVRAGHLGAEPRNLHVLPVEEQLLARRLGSDLVLVGLLLLGLKFLGVRLARPDRFDVGLMLCLGTLRGGWKLASV